MLAGLIMLVTEIAEAIFEISEMLRRREERKRIRAQERANASEAPPSDLTEPTPVS